MRRGNGGDTAIGTIIIVVIVVIIIAIFACSKGCQLQCSQFAVSYTGANWLVVQYSQDGGVIHFWKLKDVHVKSEENSDGIFFQSGNGIVHLSGHYVYVQDWDEEIFDWFVTSRLTDKQKVQYGLEEK